MNMRTVVVLLAIARTPLSIRGSLKNKKTRLCELAHKSDYENSLFELVV